MTVTIGTHMQTKPAIRHGINVFKMSTKSIPSEAYMLVYAKRTPRNDGELRSFFFFNYEKRNSVDKIVHLVVERMQD